MLQMDVDIGGHSEDRFVVSILITPWAEAHHSEINQKGYKILINQSLIRWLSVTSCDLGPSNSTDSDVLHYVGFKPKHSWVYAAVTFQ